MDGLAEYNDFRSPEYQAILVVDYDDGRLFPLTENIPKCLLPIANRKLLSYQLDMLSKSGIAETFIVAPEEYKLPLTQYLTDSSRENHNTMKVEIITIPEMTSTAQALHAVADRIRGDFFYISADVISQVGLIDLANLHRLSVSDVTIFFTIPNNKELLKDDVDQEYIGITTEGRIVIKTPTLELEGELSIQKTLFQQIKAGNSVTVRNDLLDLGIYLFSYWIIEFIKDSYRRLSSIKNDLIPYLINRQFQKKEYLENKIPALKFRKRPLGFLENWLTSKEHTSSSSVVASPSQPHSTVIPSNDLSLQTISDFQSEADEKTFNGSDVDNNQDLLRCYGLIYRSSASFGAEVVGTASAAAATSPPSLILSRLNTIQTYLSLNKEMPLASYNSRTTWSRLKNFSKKEMSLIGEHVELGEQVTYRQCFVGNNCKIGKRSKLNNCVIMDGVIIGDNCIIQNSVICEKVVIENNCNLNECNIGMNYRLAPGNEIRGESLAIGSN